MATTALDTKTGRSFGITQSSSWLSGEPKPVWKLRCDDAGRKFPECTYSDEGRATLAGTLFVLTGIGPAHLPAFDDAHPVASYSPAVARLSDALIALAHPQMMLRAA